LGEVCYNSARNAPALTGMIEEALNGSNTDSDRDAVRPVRRLPGELLPGI